MSRTNLDLTRAAYATRFGSEEWSAWIEEFVAPDLELEDRTLPEVSKGVRGPEAAYANAAHMRDSFEEISYEIEELGELPDGRVLVRVHASARGRGSGMQVDGTLGHLWSWSAGMATRLDVYATWDDALQAVQPPDEPAAEGNAEILRRLFDAFNRQDAAAVRAMWTTDSEWRPAFIGGGLLEGAVFRGHEGLAEFLSIQADTWDSVNASPVAIREFGDRALVQVQLNAVGRASGAPVDQITWNVFELEDGKVVTGRVYTSEADALEALGLSE